jgi:hypothetical protein
VVKAVPQSDQQLSLTGMAEGQAQLFITGTNGKDIYSANVVVSGQPGHAVRLFNGTSHDFTGYYCEETFCGRADKELNGARDVSSVTTISPGGTAITRTFGGSK